MTLTESIKHASRFNPSAPMISLFGVSTRGEYTLITSTTSPDEIVRQFKESAAKRTHSGLDVRVDGVTIQFDRA